MDVKPIVLIGMRAAGKSVVGDILATQLKLNHIDTDSLILVESGLPSFHDILVKKGELWFAETESQTLAQRLNRQNIISLGGKALHSRYPEISQRNIEFLKQATAIFLSPGQTLDQMKQTLYARVKHDRNREYIHPDEVIRHKINQSLEFVELYNQIADININTQKMDPSEVADLIVARTTITTI